MKRVQLDFENFNYWLNPTQELSLCFYLEDMVSVVTPGYIFTPEDLELGTTEEQGEERFLSFWVTAIVF